MMSNDQFYLRLPSNSSLENYPQNTLAEYITQLPRPIQLDGEWEVALVEIQYPRTWNNVRDDRSQPWLYIRPASGKPWNAEKVPYGFYTDVDALTTNINQAIAKQGQEARDNIKLSFDHLSGKVTVEIKSDAELAFGSDIATVLGFDMVVDGTVDITLIKKTTISPRVADVNAGIYSLFVYTDIIQAQLVGDTEVCLIRLVPVEGKHGDMVTRTFRNSQYLPISKKQFSTIEVNIKTDTGEKVPFESGKVITTLHFRRSSYLP